MAFEQDCVFFCFVNKLTQQIEAGVAASWVTTPVQLNLANIQHPAFGLKAEIGLACCTQGAGGVIGKQSPFWSAWTTQPRGCVLRFFRMRRSSAQGFARYKQKWRNGVFIENFQNFQRQSGGISDFLTSFLFILSRTLDPKQRLAGGFETQTALIQLPEKFAAIKFPIREKYM
ncbi:MAG: hypothetical protein ACO3A4_04225 [Silvanigrellaceae bacterium]